MPDGQQKPINVHKLVDHLFRHESGKMIATLTRFFGSQNINLAEDAVQDALLAAIKTWTYSGIPENPTAWLYRVAKNKALNLIKKRKYQERYETEVKWLSETSFLPNDPAESLFSEEKMLDDQLKMMFICCHPQISLDSQIALILKTLCGFSIPEIARAFLSKEESINKRLVRARKKIKDGRIPFELPDPNTVNSRISVVMEAIYLLFNEGYNASGGNDLIRYELCEEAMRLADLLLKHPISEKNSGLAALQALMQLNASRFASRVDSNGNIVTLKEQDRSKWDQDLIKNGLYNLERSFTGDQMSRYHFLASISAYHCIAGDFGSTRWEHILVLYNKLMQMDDSPLIKLNRAVVLSQVAGPEKALEAMKSISHEPVMINYHLYHSTLAELYMRLGLHFEAAKALEKAIDLTQNSMEENFLRIRLNQCRKEYG